MLLKVLLQGAIDNKRLPTDRALMRPKLGVDTFVHVPRTALRKALGAKAAWVWLLPDVRTNMDLQVSTLRERSPTNVTDERADAMHLLVMSKGCRVVEADVAVSTRVHGSHGRTSFLALVLCVIMWNGIMDLVWARRW